MPFNFERHAVGAVTRILSVPVTHIVDGTPHDRRGIFTRQHELLDVSGDLAVGDTAPSLAITLSEWVPAPKPTDGVEIAGESFTISDPQDHGEGAGLLILREAP